MITLEKISRKLKIDGKFWISFSGDSITSCEWVHPNWRDIVQYVLQEEITNLLQGDWKTSEWGVKGFNFAFDGATTKDILNKADQIKTVDPDLVIVLMGENDPLFGISVSQSIENIKKVIQNINTRVVWCTSIYSGSDKKNNQYKPYARAFMRISENDNFQKIDMFNLFRKFPLKKFFTFISEENPIEQIKKGEPDLIHPNQLGNAYIAKVILKEVFGIDFDPELYWSNTLAGQKYPGY